MTMDERWGLGSTLATFAFLWMAARQYLPAELEYYLARWVRKLSGLIYPYVQISFPEYAGERIQRSQAYAAIEAYLSATSAVDRARRLKGEVAKDSTQLVLSMDRYEEVADAFAGAILWWTSTASLPETRSISFYPAPEERRHYRLIFHRRHRRLVQEKYLPHVLAEGKAAGVRRRQRKLYTNNPSHDWYSYRKRMWSHVAFEHPATFETLAMSPEKKADILQDLRNFSQSKEYYARIGKPWKRGYLLYGPPGTGKSTMVAAMANFLDYDVYDLELTAVKNNSTLRKLLIETTGRSIIVIEDIDCSLDLTGSRKREDGGGEKSEEEKAKEAVASNNAGDKDDSKVTLSGLLNFIDGLWSACGGERLIVFTTNHVEKLDPALIRRGRMDKHIELSYCSFDAFLVLAKNYLGVDDHPLFDAVRRLMGEAKITPADVAENLIPRTRSGAEEEVDACLRSLIRAMEESKAKAAAAAAAAATAVTAVPPEDGKAKDAESKPVAAVAAATATPPAENGILKETEN